MKKYVLVLLLITGIVFCVFGQNGVIRELTGEVEIKSAGASDFVRASAGDTIALNTIVSTGFRSTAIVEIGSSLITVRPLTRLSLAEIRSMDNTENVNLNLQAGRIRVDVNPLAGTRTNLSVQSPSATASVRGTSFDFDTVNLKVNKGKMVFSGNAGPPVIVGAGNSSFIDKGGTPADPVKLVMSTLSPSSPLGVPTGASQLPSDNPSWGTGDIGFDLIYE